MQYYNTAALEDYTTTDIEGMFNMNATQPSSVNVTIVDNGILESNEIFQVEISLQNSEDSNCVILQPNVIDVTIVDDDSG